MYVTHKAMPTQEVFQHMRFKQPISLEIKGFGSNFLGLFFIDLYLQKYAKIIFKKISRYLPLIFKIVAKPRNLDVGSYTK